MTEGSESREDIAYKNLENYISETLDMSSKQLGEMFEGDSADMYTGQFPRMMGAERRVLRVQSRERE